MPYPVPQGPVHLTPDALDWALAHAREFGDTVFVPKAFEYAAIEHQWKSVRDWIVAQDMAKWAPRPPRRFLVNKSEFSFRYVTQLDPLEYLAFTALLLEIGPSLEATRIPATEGVVYSWRFAPEANGQMYDPTFEWAEFVERCLDHATEPAVEWVVVADIADFFPHIYIHPVERVLAAATGASPASYCALRMIKNWNAFVSYGLPVGIAGSRIIAEATIDDIDRGMVGLGMPYCRYADDIRVFCETRADANAALEALARALFENHGLTLQPSKTEVMPADEYRNRFALTPDRIEAESLTTQFHDLLQRAGVADRYSEDIEYNDLPATAQAEIDALNLDDVFQEQLGEEAIDPIVLRILLHRLGQLNVNVVDDILNNLEKFVPVMDSVVRYLKQLRNIPSARRATIGASVLRACEASEASSYQRMCLLSLFTESREFDNETEFERLDGTLTDPAARRELILALGRAHREHWLMQRRRDAAALDPWTRRAFYAAFSAVTPEPRDFYYRSLRGGADILETAVIEWSQANPF